MFKDSTVSPDSEAGLPLILVAPSWSMFVFVFDQNAGKKSRIGAGEELSNSPCRPGPRPLNQPLFPAARTERDVSAS